MNYKTTILLLLYLIAGGEAAAQQLYKSVGPDGKVTYTDRPPAGEASAKVSVMKSYVLRPLDAPPPPSLSSGLPPPSADAVRRASATPAAASAPKEGVPLEVEQAVAGVLGLSELFRRSEDLCSKSVPGQRYANSLGKWRERNASFLQKEKHILMTVLTPTLRAALQAAVNEKNDKVLAPVASAQPAARQKWCEKGFDDVDSGMHDVANNAALSIPLITFTQH
jgi:hypothetical protein